MFWTHWFNPSLSESLQHFDNNVWHPCAHVGGLTRMRIVVTTIYNWLGVRTHTQMDSYPWWMAHMDHASLASRSTIYSGVLSMCAWTTAVLEVLWLASMSKSMATHHRWSMIINHLSSFQLSFWAERHRLYILLRLRNTRWDWVLIRTTCSTFTYM